MTEPDFWASTWGAVICDDCDLVLWLCRCDLVEPVDHVADDVEGFLTVYSSEHHSE